MPEVDEYMLKERFDTYEIARCNWCVPIILLSIWYNVCACHSPVYPYITATAVYLIQRIIAACVVVM